MKYLDFVEDIVNNKTTIFGCSVSTDETELISFLRDITDAEVYSEHSEHIWIDKTIDNPLIINLNGVSQISIDMLPILINETERRVILIYHYFNSIVTNGINGSVRRVPTKLGDLCNSTYLVVDNRIECSRTRYGAHSGKSLDYKGVLRLLKIKKLTNNERI